MNTGQKKEKKKTPKNRNSIRKNIFACLLSVHTTISLSWRDKLIVVTEIVITLN